MIVLAWSQDRFKPKEYHAQNGLCGMVYTFSSPNIEKEGDIRIVTPRRKSIYTQTPVHNGIIGDYIKQEKRKLLSFSCPPEIKVSRANLYIVVNSTDLRDVEEASKIRVDQLAKLVSAAGFIPAEKYG
jgi:hypothetical protein